MTIKAIQGRTGANIQIPPEPDSDDPRVRTIKITGSKEQAEAAQNEVYDLLSNGPTGEQQNGQTAYMKVPDDKVLYFLHVTREHL